MGIEITGTRVTRKFLGNVTAKCPVCGEIQRADIYRYMDSEYSRETWVTCIRCTSDFVVEAIENQMPVRERRRATYYAQGGK